jgi:hypothetical protein
VSIQQLLLRVHRDLSTRALRMLKPAASEFPVEHKHGVFKFFSAFALQGIRSCSETFSKALDLARSSDPTVEERELLGKLQQSFFGRSLSSFLLPLLWLGHPFSANDFLPTLTVLLLELDKINSRLAEAPTPLPATSRATGYKVERKVFESQHPYCTSLRYRYVDQGQVTIPDAAFLTLKFDRRCATDAGSDYLGLFLDFEHQIPIVFPKGTDTSAGTGVRKALEGRSWPKGEFRVPGNTIYYKFNVMSGYRLYGFRCTVTGYIPAKGGKREFELYWISFSH